MSENDDEIGTRTVVDSRLLRQPLRSGLIPAGTTIVLRVAQGPDAGRVFDLSVGGEYVLGREGADIALSDPKVSRKHAELNLYGPLAYSLRDLASTNGTFLNGQRLSARAAIKNGDRISIGSSLLEIELVELSVLQGL